MSFIDTYVFSEPVALSELMLSDTAQ